MFSRRVVLLLGLLAVATACGSYASGQGVDPPATAAVGGLPAEDSNPTSTAAAQTSSTAVGTTVTVPVASQVGALVPGNRVILIGDSVMASTSQRYGGEMCDALVPLGWQAEVDAESGRFIDFGAHVLDKRLSAGWDASVILLGNNYGDNQPVYREYLESMVMRLSPQPVVLLTVTEFKASRTQVNDVIRELAAKYPNVIVLDWAAVTAADPSSLQNDGLHLVESGRAVLAQQIAMVLGPAPVQPGKCLSTNFRDDSSATTGGNGGGNGTATTVKPNKTATTVANTGTTAPHGTTPVTTPVVTSPPATSPPPPPTVTEAPAPTLPPNP
ncbi:MAG: hypothetical protein WCC60_13405 [Ilumatobacteraceae bacterium]